MVATLAAMAVLSTAPIVALPTAVWPLAPEAKVRADGEPLVIKATKPRAVLLIHGLLLRPIRTDKLVRPELHDWQQVKSELVKALAADADVYAFGYAQTVPVDVVSLSPGFIGIVEKLRKAGYKEIVLLGHSAGGLIARHFVERFPEAGVTKVIQVASPNAGSDLANIPIGIPRLQQGFVKSLAQIGRAHV